MDACENISVSTFKTFTFKVSFVDVQTASVQPFCLKGHHVVGQGYCGALMCTGLTYWPISDLLTEFIGSRAPYFSNKIILEVGCGLGLCGIVTGHAVGLNGKVILTDGDEEVLQLAEKNIQMNNVEGSAVVEILEWSNHDQIQSILSRYASDSQGVDVVIGSDVLYAGIDTVKSLFNTVNGLLRGKHNKYSTQNGKLKTEEYDFNHIITAEESVPDDCDLIPTGAGGGWLINNDEESINLTKSPNELEPIFILGYVRRYNAGEANISQILNIANEAGFDWAIADDYVLDMFGNRTSELTMFWEKCVFIFTRKPIISDSLS
eukprot:gene4783-6708_t